MKGKVAVDDRIEDENVDSFRRRESCRVHDLRAVVVEASIIERKWLERRLEHQRTSRQGFRAHSDEEGPSAQPLD